MRVCILKQPYVTEFTWKSHKWSTEQELLDNYICRSQNFGLVCETQADIWVVEDGEYVSDTYASLRKNAPEAVKALYRSHSAAKWADVPWDEYDVVISLDSIVPDSTIVRYPGILWCYYEQEHVKESFKRSAEFPYGKYDLFLNHELSSNFSTSSLPKSINFPYLCSKDAFSKVVPAEKHNRVYLDSHCIRGVSDLELLRAQLEQKFGIEVTHSKPWDFDNSYKCVADKVPSSTREYLNQLASCRYYLLNRGWGIAQSAPEAAALAVIVLSDKGGVYSHYLCHPRTWVKPHDYDSAARVIRKIQDNPVRQQEILKYQFEKVQDFFLDEPLKVLQDCLENKRRAERVYFYAGYPKHRTSSFPKMLTHQLARLKRRQIISMCKKLLVGIMRRSFLQVVEMRRSLIFRLKMLRSEWESCQKLSVIFVGRNDSYATSFKERVMAAVSRNQAEAAKRNLDVEWIFVEWNPLSKDYLSYELAQKGFRCYVVSPDIHQRIVSPQVSHRMTFMQFFPKNVGIRRATGDWILVTNADCVFDDNIWEFISNQNLCPHILYRAERCDVPASYFNKPFEVMRANIVRYHSVDGGKHFTQGAGDFVLFSRRNLMGYDEMINFSDAHVDGRFCRNWAALRSGGDPDNWHFFKFIGQVFKADHELIFARTQYLSNHHKGVINWDSSRKSCKGAALYENDGKWGLIDEPESKLAEDVWYIG